MFKQQGSSEPRVLQAAPQNMTDTDSKSLGIMSKPVKKSKSRSEKAGLLFPVSKFNRHLRDSRKTKRVGAGAPIYLAAVLEYATTEILELAEKQLGKKKKRITPLEIMKAVRKDEELNALLGGVAFFTSDRVKNVSQAITYVPKKAKKAEEEEEEERENE